MKKSLLFLSLLAGASNLVAQDADQKFMSPAEKFANRKGTVLQKRFDEVDKIDYLNIQLEYISDLSNNDKMKCLRFDIQVPNNSAGPSAMLDSGEVNELLNFLNYITTNVVNRPPADPNTEISYTDKYNLLIGCYWQKNNGWILYLRTNAQDPTTEIDINAPKIQVLFKDLISVKQGGID